MDDLAEPVVRGTFRVVLWFIRLLLEALFEYVIEAASRVSRRRSWSGWIPVAIVAGVGAILAGLACSDGQPWAGLILLTVFLIPAAVRAVYVAVVPA